MSEQPFTKKEERKFTKYILIGFLSIIIIGVTIGIFFGERGIELFIGVIVAAFIGYGIGENRGVSKVSKGKQAKEEADAMIASGNICGATEVDRNHGMSYGAEKFWRIYETIESETRRHKREAEEEEELLRDLLNLLEKPKSKTQ